MTEQNPMPPDDHELEQFLSRRSDLSQHYRADAAGEGASPELDALVLAQAQIALQTPPLRSRRFVRWGRPLAVAASLVLVVSLGWMAQQKPLPQQMAPAAAPAVVPVEVAAPAMDAAATLPAVKAGELKKRKIPARSADLPAHSQTEPVEQYDKTAAAVPPPPSSPPAAAAGQTAAPSIPAKPVAPESRDRGFALKREAPQQSAEGFVTEADSAAAGAAVSSNAPAVRAPFAPAPTPPGMTSPAEAAPAASLAAAPNPCAASPSRVAVLGQTQAGRGPDAAAWLEQIRRLRDASDLAGARAELACFSYLHAPAEVPDDLRPLMPGRP